MIIPTCNRNELLGKCLDRLMPGTQTLAADAYEVIVSDDGAGEGAKTFCRQHYPWVRYVRGPRRGPAANRNNGASIAAGDWLVFTDDDCLPDTGWLHAYLRAIAAFPDCKAFEGAIWPDDEELLKKDMAECPVNTKGGCFWSANIMVQRDLFKKIGGFNERFKLAANEDQYIMKMILPYTAITFVEQAKVVHGVRLPTLLEKISKSRAMARSWIGLLLLEKLSMYHILLKALSNSFRYIFTAIRHGKLKTLLYHLYNLLVVFPQVPFLVIQEKKMNN